MLSLEFCINYKLIQSKGSSDRHIRQPSSPCPACLSNGSNQGNLTWITINLRRSDAAMAPPLKQQLN